MQRCRMGIRINLAVDPNRLGDLITDFKNRIEGGKRFLEHHGNTVTADALHLFVGQRQQIPAVEQDPAADNFSGRLGDKAEYTEGRNGLAAAGLSHQTDRFFAPDVVAHAVDGFGSPPVGTTKVNLEVFDR